MALPIKVILVPMQLDDPDAAALRVAKRLAQESDASICAMHVIPIDPLVMAPGAPTDIYARDLEKAKEDFQRRYVLEVLERNNGNRTQTARDLGVDPRTIFRHLEKEQGGGGFEEDGAE